MNERILRHYVGRINTENGEQSIMQFDRYSGIFRVTQDMTSSNGFEDATARNKIVSWLNAIDDELGGKFYYYRLDSDNRTNKNIPQDAPEDVLRWFNDDPEQDPDSPANGEIAPE